MGIEIKNVVSHEIYQDRGFFYDHIIELDDHYINFCQVTDVNRARYQLLLEINKLESTYFLPSDAKLFTYDGQEWFYERVQKLGDYTMLSPSQVSELWLNLQSLNTEVNALEINQELVMANNKFFKEISYYNDLKEMVDADTFELHDHRLKGLYMNYGDIEKSIELGRIYHNGDNFVVTGLQAFIPCPEDYAKIASIILASVGSTDIHQYLEMVDHSYLIPKIVQQLRDQIHRYPEYYKLNVTSLSKHIDLIEKKWQESQ